jgi:hypothetical protein
VRQPASAKANLSDSCRTKPESDIGDGEELEDRQMLPYEQRNRTVQEDF